MTDETGLRSRQLDEDRNVFINRTGRFFVSTPEFGSRFNSDRLSQQERDWLHREGHDPRLDLEKHALAFARAQRKARAGPLQYLILVPTLRCNLACSYCQVSRTDEKAKGFDWDDATLKVVCEIVANLKVPKAKIEFQGGEPTLRPDLINAVMEAAPKDIDLSFVICTNLQKISPEIVEIFDRSDVQISTSLDGDIDTHTRQRLGSNDDAEEFSANLEWLVERYGPDKISALPTIDASSLPDIDALIYAYLSRGLTSIYLRPVNYHGFARKRHPSSISQSETWSAFHRRFVETLIRRNWQNRDVAIEETYLSHVLKRIFRPGVDGHVDLRSPNPMGQDYVVIDFDGKAYPTDEARMLSRSGVIDLAIGNVHDGWNTPERDALNAASTNAGDPVCEKCAYQPYCGRDLIDDIARYGTVEIPRNETEFCKRHLRLFDLAFELIYDPDEAVQYSLRRWLGLATDNIELGARV